jgi:phosphoglycerol transferase
MKIPLRFPAYFLGLFLLGFSQWLGASFDNPSIDQILYHLHYSQGLGIDVGRIFLLTFAVECIAFPLALALAASILHTVLMRPLEGPQRLRVRRAAGALLPGMAVAVGVTALMVKLSVFPWIGYHFAQDRFKTYYVDPRQAQPREGPGKLKNLVLIYVESLEDTYGDARIWGRDLLRPVRDLGGVSFANYRPAPGATWTIAAIVATQCGVPLRVVSQYDIKQRGENARAFLPGATCLGDILHEHGFRNVFLGGAPLSFAGKGQFFTDHHYHVAYGREQWQKEGVGGDALGEWGLYDEALYAQAKVKLEELHRSGQRFNLTMLTLDTHNPHGFRSPGCRRRGLRSFEDIVSCASHELADFVQFIQRKGYLEDTNVVIVGDHLAVSNPVYDSLRKISNRRMFNRFISQDLPSKNTEDILPFDLFPSILEFMGFDVPGKRLGLGQSAFGGTSLRRPEEMLEELALPSLSGSASYGRLWQDP